MTPGQIFLLILLLLYLSDCFLLVPRRGYAFLSISGRKNWRTVLASTALGNDRGGLVMTTPLPPLGRAFTAGFWPISLTPEGFSAAALTCVNPGVCPPVATAYMRWDELESVGWEGRVLIVNDRRFAKLASPQVARDYARLLHRLGKLTMGERPRAIRRWCSRELNAKRVRRRVAIFERATSGLRFSCNALFLLAFIGIPTSHVFFKGQPVFWAVLASCALLMVMVGIEFWCLHRRFYRDLGGERFQLWMLVGFMPQYSIRAVDELSKAYFGNAHPLAIAEALLDDGRFRAFRDAVLRDLRHPEPPPEVVGEEAPLALAAALTFREEFEHPAVEAVTHRRLEVPVKDRPEPGGVETGMTKYCPRCLMTYGEVAEDCIDCGGVRIRKLGGG